MCIFNRINEKAKLNAKSISRIEADLGFGNGVIGKWKKQEPSSIKLLAVANYLNTTVDYLLTGKEKEPEPTPAPALTENEQELLEIFKKLNEREQLKVIVRLEDQVKPSAKIE